MTALRRHTLVWLSRAPEAETDDDRARGLSWHAAHRPFIVTRRRSENHGLSLGFCTIQPHHPELRPRRTAAHAEAQDVLRRARPPSIGDLSRCAAVGPHAASFARLALAASDAGVNIRIYGSWMWQALTGERHVHDHSDLDVLVDVADTDAADRAVAFLEREEANLAFRIDGELSIAGLGEVNWREYRQGKAELLLKSVDSLRLVPRSELRP